MSSFTIKIKLLDSICYPKLKGTKTQLQPETELIQQEKNRLINHTYSCHDPWVNMNLMNSLLVLTLNKLYTERPIII